ncbi:protein associated with UVRAG as autophagy enhancer isoform X1 [Hemiscyllium ocellatum]|uniref:protein associated with UVRAG as autophagy enhancer isoform X1 n=1 Tax=Hemiscyllium ocellatum TaxID=170820 RepID=UPI002966FEDB|nr:protein associated with UVRAG as autophagy enhancer isoform X1 [Hemiscyllium ocellatum]XP_060688896.1 protein associated with UVRAG as autophagy enhancer isoform X1 [Hemiscyllium ocellatum]XP_060688897.1 protein associated with UVRAG as autophagy enhancer isoform X1 [Hemiscyllium ocellatum]
MKQARKSSLLPVSEAKVVSASGFHLNTLCLLPQSPSTSALPDEYSTPAVMGQTAVHPGQPSNNPEAIKEILSSVLETFDGFKPLAENSTAITRLSALTVFQDGASKDLWESRGKDEEQRHCVEIAMMTCQGDSCSSSSSLTHSPEKSSSRIIFNPFSKLLTSVQSTASRHMSFTGAPPSVSKAEEPHYQRSQSDSNIHPERAQHGPNNRPGETIVYTSYLSNPSFSASRAQERENTHLVVADMVIAALENVKSNMYEQAELLEDCSLAIVQTPGDEMSTCIKKEAHSNSVNSVDSGYECGSASQLDDCSDAGSKSLLEDKQNGDAVGADDDDYDDFVIIEFDDVIFGSDGPLKSIERHCLSAEYLARRLFKSFRVTWLPPETEVHHFDTVEKVLDEFLPLKDTLPGAEESVDLTPEFKLNSRLRGTADWAPPRFQILFFIHAPQRRETVVAAQNSMCAGCGTPIEQKYIKKLRYCDYLGKYFCECCHHNEESPIPGRILMKWDFSKHPVCHFSKQLLESIWHDPLFNIFYINKCLYSKVKELRKAKEIQEQLIHIKKLLRTCRLAERAMIEFYRICSHLTEELHLYSLNDLLMVKQGLLVPGLKGALKNVLAHVESCELCLAKGFICEFCKSRDILFPFQTDQCKRCDECKACFHKECFKTEQCPKCIRIRARKELLLAFQQPGT